MSRSPDIEHGKEYKPLEQTEAVAEENEALLAEATVNRTEDYDAEPRTRNCYSRGISAKFSLLHLIIAFVGGFLACLGATVLFPSFCLSRSAPATSATDLSDLVASPDAGSTEVHNYPPVSPTNGETSLFPTDVGYAGITPTGAEAAVVQTAPMYPIHTGAPNLVTPSSKGGAKGSKKGKFDMFKSWGNLSPWYSVERGTFGVDSGPEAPEHCSVTGLHFLHRHGARYPTAYGKLNCIADLGNC